jgi:tetratricopeptide (TPR) repeat protein
MNRQQLLLIGGLSLVGVSLFVFGKKTALQTENNTRKELQKVISEHGLITEAKSSLPAEAKKETEKLEKTYSNAKSVEEKSQALAGIAVQWDQNTQWAIAGLYYDSASKISSSSELAALAGTRFLAAADMTEDSTMRPYLSQRALQSLLKATELAPEDLNIQAEYGNALALLGENPMAGIQKLREITQKDSLHLKANFHLAQLSIRSGQFDKAINRFNLINRTYPSFPDAWLGKGEAWYNLQNVPEALKALETYKALVKDPVVLQQVDAFISQIKKSKP